MDKKDIKRRLKDKAKGKYQNLTHRQRVQLAKKEIIQDVITENNLEDKSKKVKYFSWRQEIDSTLNEYKHIPNFVRIATLLTEHPHNLTLCANEVKLTRSQLVKIIDSNPLLSQILADARASDVDQLLEDSFTLAKQSDSKEAIIERRKLLQAFHDAFKPTKANNIGKQNNVQINIVNNASNNIANKVTKQIEQANVISE